MSKTMLTTLRIFIPGLIILILVLLLRPDKLIAFKNMSSFEFREGTVSCMLVLVLGALYYILGIREYFIKDSHEQIRTNIKDKLLEPFRNNTSISCQFDTLKRNRTMLHIFYNLIDNDESLKEKAKNIYLNGLIWTSIADVMALTLLGSILYICIFCISFYYYYLIITLILIAIHFLFKYICLPKITAKHIDIGNEQIEYIHVHFKQQLERKIKDFIGGKILSK